MSAVSVRYMIDDVAAPIAFYIPGFALPFRHTLPTFSGRMTRHPAHAAHAAEP